MLSEILKEGTKINHQLLEKKLVAKMRTMSSEKDYADLLLLFYSYFGGLELAIDRHLDLSRLPDYAERRKTSALAHDLEKMETPLPVLAAGDELPAIASHFEALGALYVIEGSTLGGSIISKMIKQQLPGNDKAGYAFFDSYGADTMRMWQAFKATLDEPVNLPGHAIVVKAANDTFIKFSAWFDRQALS